MADGRLSGETEGECADQLPVCCSFNWLYGIFSQRTMMITTPLSMYCSGHLLDLTFREIGLLCCYHRYIMVTQNFVFLFILIVIVSELDDTFLG